MEKLSSFFHKASLGLGAGAIAGTSLLTMNVGAYILMNEFASAAYQPITEMLGQSPYSIVGATAIAGGAALASAVASAGIDSLNPQ